MSLSLLQMDIGQKWLDFWKPNYGHGSFIMISSLKFKHETKHVNRTKTLKQLGNNI